MGPERDNGAHYDVETLKRDWPISLVSKLDHFRVVGPYGPTNGIGSSYP